MWWFMLLCVHSVLCLNVTENKVSATLNNEYCYTKQPRSGIPEVDALQERVRSDVWSGTELPCKRTVLELLDHLQNNTLWATWIWDSMQRPSGTFHATRYQLGSLEQCLSAPWIEQDDLKTQYCLADIVLADAPLKEASDFDPYDSAELYFRTKSKAGRHLNVVTWGVCMPAVCSAESVTKIVRQMFGLTHLSGTASAPRISVYSCQQPVTEVEGSYEYYVVICMGLLLFLTVVISTCYQRRKDLTNSFASKITKTFCLKRNFNSLVEFNGNEIGLLNGIRFISSVCIIAVHYYVFIILSANTLNVDQVYISNFGKAISHKDLYVDTFFALSGLLLVKSLLSNKRKIRIWKQLLKRYVRLIGPIAVITVFIRASAIPYGRAPLWKKFSDDEHRKCMDNWWQTFLMLTVVPGETCYVIVWYIICDFHMTVVGTIICYLYQKDPRMGVMTFATFAAFSVVIPGLVTYWRALPPLMFDSLQDVIEFKNYDSLVHFYPKSYNRAGPYMVGMMCGFILSVYKPGDHRKSVCMIWSIFGAFLSLMTMLALSLLGFVFFTRPYSLLEAAITAAFQRSVWAVGLCIFIGLCEYGTVPLITEFLSWSAFRPLSRLSYGIYLLHPAILSRMLMTTNSPLEFDKLALIVNVIGTTFVSSIGSLILWITVEAPLSNIMNHFLT